MAYKCKNDIKIARKLLTAIGSRMYWLLNDSIGLCDHGVTLNTTKSYKYIKENLLVLCDLYAMIYNFTTDDNTHFNKCVTEKTFKKQLQDLCDYCGIKDEDID